MSRRTRDERLSDELVVLSLVAEANEHRSPQDIMNVMKMVFVAAWELAQHRIRAISLRFIAGKHGPFSREVYDLLDTIVGAGLLSRGWGIGLTGPFATYEVTRKGRQVLQDCLPLLKAPENEAVLRAITEAGAEVGSRPSWENRQIYHNKEIPHPDNPAKTVSIGDLTAGTTILNPPDKDQAEGRLQLDDDWYETLEIVLSPDYDPEAMRTASDASHEQLFADV